jgi:hypothetical protein
MEVWTSDDRMLGSPNVESPITGGDERHGYQSIFEMAFDLWLDLVCNAYGVLLCDMVRCFESLRLVGT